MPQDIEKDLLERISSFYAIESENKGKIIDALNNVLGSILFSQPTIETLTRLFKVNILFFSWNLCSRLLNLGSVRRKEYKGKMLANP